MYIICILYVYKRLITNINKHSYSCSTCSTCSSYLIMSYNTSSDHIIGNGNSSSSNSSSSNSMIRDLHEGWREAIALATERQAIIDAMIREKTIADKKRDDDAKSMRSLVDGIYEASLLLANEVSSRQAINDSTTYKPTTTTTAIPSSSTHDTNATLSVILQRLNSVISIVSTQDIKMTLSKDDIKRLHGLFISEKKAREEMKQREEEEVAREREKENRDHHNHLQQQHQQQQQQQHSLNCERIIEEETSVITEDTTNNSTTKKKVAKKKVAKK